MLGRRGGPLSLSLPQPPPLPPSPKLSDDADRVTPALELFSLLLTPFAPLRWGGTYGMWQIADHLS
jgi:hypothetical protein